jgi:hypothetical protein
MMKILLGASIPEPLLSVSRNEYRSGRQLAEAAWVSVMSASSFVRQLLSQGFLDERKGSLRLVRIEELMHQWLGASRRRAREIPVRWIIPGGKDQLLSAVHSYSSRLDAKPSRSRKPQALAEFPNLLLESVLVYSRQQICSGSNSSTELHRISISKDWMQTP